MWYRSVRLTLLFAWVVALGVAGYLLSHPRLLAPSISAIVSRNIFHDREGSLRFRDFSMLSNNRMHVLDVALTLKSESGGITLIAIDTLKVDFRYDEFFTWPRRLRQVEMVGVETFVMLGDSDDEEQLAPSCMTLDLKLPQLQIGLLNLVDGSCEISASDGRLMQRFPSIDWRGVVELSDEIRLEFRDATIDWETHRSRLENLYGLVLISNEGVSVENLHVFLNEHTEGIVSGTRRWDSSIDLDVDGTDGIVSEIEDLINLDLGFRARGDLDATFVSGEDAILFDGVFSGELEGYDMEEILCSASFTDTCLYFDTIAGTVNGAVFDGTGRFSIVDSLNFSFILDGQATDANLAQRLVPIDEVLPRTDGNGHVRIWHRLNPLATRVSCQLVDGAIETIPFDSCDVVVFVDDDGLVFERCDLLYQGSTARLLGQADTSRWFSGRIDVDVPDLSRMPAQWNWPDIEGRLQGSGTLRGRDEDIAFDGLLDVGDVALGAVTAGEGRVLLKADRILGTPSFHFRWQGDDLRLGGVQLGQYRGVGSADSLGVELDEIWAEHGDTVVSGSGRVRFGSPAGEFHIPEFSVSLEGTQWRLADEIRFSAGDSLVEIPGLRLASEQGSLALRGSWRRNHGIDSDLQLRNFDLSLLNPFLDGRRVTGYATADAVVTGSTREPAVSLQADIVACETALARIDSLHVDGRLREGVISLQDLYLDSNHGQVRASGTIEHAGAGLNDYWPDASLDLVAEIRDGDWAFLDQFQLPALERISGRFDGDVAAGGTTTLPLIRGDFVSAPFNIHWAHLDTVTGRALVESDHLILADLHGNQDDLQLEGRIELPMEFNLYSEPLSPPNGPFMMRLAIPQDSDLSPLLEATNAFTSCSGRGSGEVVIAGVLEHPLWSGSASVRDGAFMLRGLEEIYYDIDIDGEFSGDDLILSRIHGREGERGIVQGAGTVTFEGLELETFALDLDVDRFLVASIPELRALVRGDSIRLSGEKVGPEQIIVPKFSGELDVIKARYTGDFQEKPGAVDPRAATTAPDWLADLHLVSEPRAIALRNNTMELALGGDVDLTRDLEGLYLRGTLNVDTGEMPIFNQNFRIVRGRLDFSHDVGLDPLVDIEAETSIRVRSKSLGDSSILEKVTLSVSNTLYEPVVSFSSESGYQQLAIQRMLLGLPPDVRQQGSGNVLTTSTMALGLNFLERQVAAEVDLIDTIDIQQIERVGEDGQVGTVPLIGVGKFLTKDLYVKYAQGLAAADRDVIVEYQISQHLVLQSEIRQRLDEMRGENTYSLDLKYRHEY